MAQDIVIYGIGGFGREVMQTVLDLGSDVWRPLGWLDDATEVDEVHGQPVLGSADWLREHPEVAVTVAIGSSAARSRVNQRITKLGHDNFATLVHPSAYVGRNVTLGKGTTVAPGVTLTTDLVVGEHNLLNVGCVLGHDVQTDSTVSIAPNTVIGGGSHLEEGVEFGMGAGARPNSVIGEWTVVGAGAFVSKDLPANVLAVGVPAKAIREFEPGWHF